MTGKRFIKITYTGKIKDGGVFDTTDADTARKENIYNEQNIYSPISIVAGDKHVIPGLDEALEKLKVKSMKKVEITPDKAYGERNPDLIRLVSLGVFRKKKINPVPGMVVELDGRYARVRTVSGGRVRVDFNHELAGKTLVFDVKVEDEAKTAKEKIRFLVERNFNSFEGFAVKTTAKKAEIKVPEEAHRDKNLLFRKASLSAELFKYLKLDEITFIEVWKNPEKDKKTDNSK